MYHTATAPRIPKLNILNWTDKGATRPCHDGLSCLIAHSNTASGDGLAHVGTTISFPGQTLRSSRMDCNRLSNQDLRAEAVVRLVNTGPIEWWCHLRHAPKTVVSVSVW